MNCTLWKGWEAHCGLTNKWHFCCVCLHALPVPHGLALGTPSPSHGSWSPAKDWRLALGYTPALCFITSGICSNNISSPPHDLGLESLEVLRRYLYHKEVIIGTIYPISKCFSNSQGTGREQKRGPGISGSPRTGLRICYK